MKNLQNPIINKISQLLELARNRVMITVNQTMVLTYFEIGRMIVEDEQNGENRAEYGKKLLKDLSIHLTEKFGRGFSETNLRQMRNFYESYSQQIQQTVSSEFKIIDKKKQQTLGDLEPANWSLSEAYDDFFSFFQKTDIFIAILFSHTTS